MPRLPLLVLTLSLLLPLSARAQSESSSISLTLHADHPSAPIPPELYGQFAEHLGRLVYDGIWVGPDSPIPNTRGLRNDVLDALRKVHVPVLRWPGGCFADEYHWRDGIGPRDGRPKRINTHWGMVTETNAFGTHEFLDLCELIGAEPYISANVGTGSPQEMKDWLEYMTSDNPDSTLANERRKNGREKPWHITFLGIGNESWGCGGNMRPEFYSDLYRQFQTFVKTFPGQGSPIRKIACGSDGKDYHWTDVVMHNVNPRMMSGLSLHWYTLPTGDWNHKGPATGFPPEQWSSTIAHAWEINDIINKHLSIMDQYDHNHRVGLVVDEWGVWTDPEPGTNPGFLYQQNTIREAVVAGIHLNVFNNHADRIMMANLAQVVNVIQSLILTDKDGMLLTPTYHVFDLFKVHQGATLLPTDNGPSDYEVGDQKIPSIYASASRDKQGLTHLSLVNARPDRPANLTIHLPGLSPTSVTGQILTADQMDAHNTFDHPDAVRPAAFNDAHLANGDLTLTLPAKSVLVLELK